jgi:Lrp/AsnC family transcriptional regulator, leucine-responsive regulatory protein
LEIALAHSNSSLMKSEKQQLIGNEPAKTSHNMGMLLDKKDHQILMALQLDARQSLAALGKRIGLSQPAISERVKKLELAGVIEGYSARINLPAVGLPLQAVVRIQTTHEHIKRYQQLFASLPAVLNVVRVTGEDCFVVRCAFAKPSDLETLVDSLAAWGSVKTALVMSLVHDKPAPLSA